MTRSRDEELVPIRAAAERVARSHGLEVFDIQLRRESIGWVLRVVLDRPAAGDPPAPEPLEAGVSIEDCQRVSQDLSAILDVEEIPVQQSYTLEVSSPGLDRPLRGPGDYHRFAGRLAKIVVREAIGGQTFFTGRLKGVEAGALVLEEGRRVHRIPLPAVSRARLAVEFQGGARHADRGGRKEGGGRTRRG